VTDTSNEPNVPVGGWTIESLKIYHDQRIDSLRELVDQRFEGNEKALTAALNAAKEAVLKAEGASEKRFESVNEFRATLSDQTNTLMPRQEYTVQHRALEEKLTELTNRINMSEGQKQGSDVTIGKIYAAVGVVGAVLGIIVLLANGVFK
jgi:hypothetical protein